MISNIKIENFKCFRSVKLRPRLITVLIGPNGSGKSSILQALVLLKQSIDSRELNVTDGSLKFSSPSDIYPKFQSYESILTIEFAGAFDFHDNFDSSIKSTVKYGYKGQFLNGALESRSGYVDFRFENKKCRIDVNGNANYTESDQIGNISVDLQKQKVIGSIARVQTWKTEVDPRIQSGIQRLLDTPKNVLKSLRFVPAGRGLGRPIYPLGNRLAEDISLSGGFGEQEQQTATNLAYSRQHIDAISELLKAVTGVGLGADVVPPQSVKINAINEVGEVNFVAEGFGANALILLLLQLISADEGATVTIEEPEIHLHPRAQADLASVLVKEAKAKDKQLIMTTHSEHILGRMLTLVAEKELSSDQLAIYSFQKDKTGVCTAEKLEVTSGGRIIGGLRNFFEPDLNELDRYIRALQSEE